MNSSGFAALKYRTRPLFPGAGGGGEGAGTYPGFQNSTKKTSDLF